MENSNGIKTALDMELKSSGGERQEAEFSKNFELPLFGDAPIVPVNGVEPVPVEQKNNAGVVSDALPNGAETVSADAVGASFFSLPVVGGAAAVGTRFQEEEEQDDADADYTSSRRNKSGRPKGARNRATEAWRRHFLAQNKSPLMFLGGVYSVSTAELAKDMGVSDDEALKFQISAAAAVLPYVHQKQPIAIETQNQILPVIYIGQRGDAAQASKTINSSERKYRTIELISGEDCREITGSED